MLVHGMVICRFLKVQGISMIMGLQKIRDSSKIVNLKINEYDNKGLFDIRIL